jgi:uncharacterized protein YqgC (DUF456 family)
MTMRSWIVGGFELAALGAVAWWADRFFRRRSSRSGRTGVAVATGLVLTLFVLLPLVGLLLLWYLGHAE